MNAQPKRDETPCVKIAHATRDAALEHVKALVWKNHVAHQDERSHGLTPYPCEHCGAWHVGHEQTAPLVWHYTVKKYLEEILELDALRPAPPTITSKQEMRRLPQHIRLRLQRLDEPAPLLWFSRNTDWEHSVLKTRRPWGRARNEVMGGGLLRFGVPASYAKLRWADYLRLNHPHKTVIESMTCRGNASEWLATDEHVPLNAVRAIEVYYRGDWLACDAISDEEFDEYIAGRVQEYNEASVTLIAKMNVARTTEQQVTLSEAERVIYEDLRMTGSKEFKKRWSSSVRTREDK